MRRRATSKRRSAGPFRKRQLLVESLEDRRLLAFSAPVGGVPDHVFAVASGTIAAPGGRVTEALDTSSHTYPRAVAVLGFEVVGSDGLDPDTVQLSGPGVLNYTVLPDISGSDNSLLLARVGVGSIDVTVGGQGGTTGDFEVRVFLPGDDNGSRKIELPDLQAFPSRLGSVVGDANYAIEVDSDLNGVITRSDAIPQRLNFGVTVVEPAPMVVPPTAVDDDPAGSPAFTVFSGNTLTISDGAFDIVERNDMVGSPAAVISSFGGGSLGGSVTDNFANTTVPTGGGGTLQVNANGSFTLVTAPSQSGRFTFDYRLDNGVGTSDATVTVEIVDATPPTVLITNPTDGQDLAIGATVPFTANAGDNVGVAQVEFFVNGVLVFADTSSPYGTFFTVPATPAPLPLLARAIDVNGNTADHAITIDPIDLTPPNISITAPIDGDDVVEGSTLTFSADATDNIGVTQVDFKVDGVTIFTDTTAPYTTSFTVPASPTPLPLEAIAFDAAGNAVSQSISVDIVPVLVPPTAVDDDPAGAPAFIVFSGNTLTISDGAFDIVERNDMVGSPAAVISSFGGGSLGGSVTDNFANTTVPTGGGGTLQVNANGSFTLVTAPSQSGRFTFDYRLDNGVGTSDATVTVEIVDATPPTVLITNPTDGQDLAIGATVPFTANAGDNVGVAQVEFFVNGVLVFADTSSPYGTFFTVPATPAPLPLLARAIDVNGNTADHAITIDPIDLTPPSISITAPSDGDDVVEGSTLTFSADAFDNVAVAEVAFKINGVTISTDNTAPYTTSFAVPASPTPLPLEAVAMDAAGNSASQLISVDIVAPVEADFVAGWQSGGSTGIITAQLNNSGGSANGQLIASGLAASHLNALHEVSFALANLGDGTLGRTSGKHVLIDINGGGRVWPVDATPGDDLEFAADGKTDSSSEANGRVDLLKVVMHELGHLLDQADGDGVMSEKQASSTRAGVDAFFARLG